MKIWYRVTITITMLLVIFALLITGFQLAVYGDSHYGFYKKEYEKYRVTDDLNMKIDNVMAVTEHMMAYLIGKEEKLSIVTDVDGEHQDFFNEQDRLHLADVRNLFLGGLKLRNYAVILATILMIVLRAKKADLRRLVPQGYLQALFVYLILAAILGVAMSIDLKNNDVKELANIERYVPDNTSFEAFRFDTDNIPGSEFFEGSKYNDGTRNVTIGWSQSSWGNNDTYQSNYTLSENSYFNELTISDTLDMNIYVPEGEIRIIRAEKVNFKGALKIQGGGRVIIYTNDIFGGGGYPNSNSLINATNSVYGNPDSLTFVYTGNVLNLSNFAKISCNIISLSKKVNVSNIDFNGNIYSTGDMKFSGTSVVHGMIYAPESNVTVTAQSIIYGLTVCDTAEASGTGTFAVGDAKTIDSEIIDTIINGGETKPEPTEAPATEPPSATENPIPTDSPIDKNTARL